MALPDRVADDYFDYLANWYATQCDGEWEHEFGIRLQTLDNPGWNLQIDLVGTELEGQVLAMMRRDLEGGGWIVVAADGALFEVSCDPTSLRLAIHEFKQLAESD